MMHRHITFSEEATREAAAEFAESLRGGEVIELVGDLGSGKTTFVRGIAEALGAKVKVKSPTFTIMNEYPTSDEKIKKIVHIDLYRFQEPQQIAALSLEDYLRPDTVVFIEWPDIFDQPAIQADRKVYFEHRGKDEREIHCEMTH